MKFILELKLIHMNESRRVKFNDVTKFVIRLKLNDNFLVILKYNYFSNTSDVFELFLFDEDAKVREL